MRSLVAVVLLLALSACGGPETMDVRGTLRLSGADGTSVHWIGSGEPSKDGLCAGDSGYGDIDAGADVVILDSHDEKVGLGTLGQGRGDGDDCVFRFSVHDVKSDDSIFSVEVTHRGDVPFKRADAGRLALTLGD